MADVAGECLVGGIPYTPTQLQDCVVSLIQLWKVSGEAEALSVCSRLINESVHQAQPWEWIGIELTFEVYVVVSGSRPRLPRSG